jgi:hypothetical protein
MFRTAALQFARSGFRAAGTIPQMTIAEIEAGARKAIDISKVQGVCQRGLVDGEYHFDLLELHADS